MSADNVAPLHPAAPSLWSGAVGDFDIEVRGDREGGVLCLRPQQGAELRIELRGDALTLRYAGPELRVSAPQATLRLGAQDIELKAERRLFLQAGEEVDVHSGEDVDVRADHQVNIWSREVLVGD